MKTHVILILSTLILFNLNVFSQNKSSIGLNGFLSLPLGDFADNEEEGDGYAKTGFGIGAEYTLGVGIPGLGWVTSATIILNPQDKSAIKGVLIDGFGMPSDGEVSATPTLNVPLYTGIKYQIQSVNAISGFIMLQTGLNIVKPGEWEGVVDGETGAVEFDASTSFGLCIGAGLVLNDNLMLGLKYFKLGEPEIDYTFDLDGSSSSESLDLNISILTINVGYNF